MRRPLTRAAVAVLLISHAAISGCKHAPPSVPAARRCAELDAANQKILGAGTSRGDAGNDEDLQRALRDATLCTETPHGAWAIVFSSLASGAGQASGRWSLVHVDGGAARASVFPDTSISLGGGGSEATAAGQNFSWSPERRVVPRAPVLYDYDGDGQAEAVVIVETVETLESGRSFRTRRGRAWSAPGGVIELYAPARNFTVEEVRDVDGDGRPDLLTHGPFAELATIKCGSEEPYPVYGPALLAHALGNGTFSFADAQAVSFAKRECAAPPTTVFVPDRDRPGFVDFAPSARNVACARLWDANAQRLATEIATNCHQQGSCPTCDDPAMLSRWTKAPPPLRLQAPRSP